MPKYQIESSDLDQFISGIQRGLKAVLQSEARVAESLAELAGCLEAVIEREEPSIETIRSISRQMQVEARRLREVSRQHA